MRKQTLFVAFISLSFLLQANNVSYWQQRVSYTMDIDFNVENHQFTGQQKLVYTNNSPDTLSHVFYHLYFNAFQPGSMMDVRSRTIQDPDRRVGSRIEALSEKEQGYHHIKSLKRDGKKINFQIEGTVMEVKLDKPILPGASTTFEMQFESQVPKQIRRSGRDNKEGIAYSMTQWYPKMAEYDYQGWHATPYIGREFHGVWGDFDLTIHIDKKYIIGGTGLLQNPEQIGYGYEEKGTQVKRPSGDKLSWHFVAKNVHDFAFAADPDYTHKKALLKNGTTLHFLYQADSNTVLWDSLPKYAVLVFEEMNKTFGEYPYKQYTVIQGGDGGMEYPMATLITGHRSKGSLIGVTAHEAIHSWYQHLLATNEAQYAWMDEGFTSYAEDVVLEKILPKFIPYQGSYRSYYSLVKSGLQEPLTTHSDHYHTNKAYGTAAYSMGCIFLRQLTYVVGEEALARSMKRYFNEWKFKHPTPNDFIRIVEKESGLELDWYLEQWTETTNTIDYGIKHVNSSGGKTTFTLERLGKMPMPLDIRIEYTDGRVEWVYIPLAIMRGEKPSENGKEKRILEKDWPWVYPYYELTLNGDLAKIKQIEIDPTERMADIDRKNNVFPSAEKVTFRNKTKKN